MDISTGHMVLAYMEDHLKNKQRLEQEWVALCGYEAEPCATTIAFKVTLFSLKHVQGPLKGSVFNRPRTRRRTVTPTNFPTITTECKVYAKYGVGRLLPQCESLSLASSTPW